MTVISAGIPASTGVRRAPSSGTETPRSRLLNLLAMLALVVGLSPCVAANDRQLLEFKDFNFRITVPQGYQSLPPEKINPAATAIFYNPVGGFNLTIIAEAIGPNLMNTEALVSVAQANLRSRTENPEFSEPEPARVGELEALRFASIAKVGVQTVHYVHWVAEHRGYLYQFVANSQKPEARSH